MPKNEFPTLNVSVESAKTFINRRIEKLQILYYTEMINSIQDYAYSIEYNRFSIWKDNTIKILKNIFQDSDFVNTYMVNINKIEIRNNNDDNSSSSWYFKMLKEYEHLLRDLISKLDVDFNIKMHRDSQLIIEKALGEILKIEEEKLKSKKIFIIYGNLDLNRADLFELQIFLNQRLGMDVIILESNCEAQLNARTLIEIFEENANKCHYAIALITPDDLVTKKKDQYFQTRPNVVFELGWFAKHLGRDKILLLEKEDSPIKIFSDFLGVYTIRYKQISNCFHKIEEHLRKADLILKCN